MQLYFLHAKSVGDLTGTFLAHLDEQLAARRRRFLPTLRRRPGRLNGFVLDRGRLHCRRTTISTKDDRLLEIFQLADKYGLEIHPQAMRQARHDAKLIDGKVRRIARANALFLDVLTSPRDPETVLRWMNGPGSSAASCPTSAESSRRCSSTCITIIRSTSIRSARSACCPTSNRIG